MSVYATRISSDHERAGKPFFDAAGITAGYGSTWIVKDVSIQASPGDIATIVGPNGAGKSTLLKVITGALRPSAGKISLGGEDVTGLSSEALARKGV
jgi:ABC-type cobalamin/Fe3+-siderophores transport system ATPase subunit